MMEGTRWQFVALIALLVVLYFVLAVGLQLNLFVPDLLVVALLLGARRMRAGAAAGFGLFLGLLHGGVFPFAMGASALVFCVLGYLAARSREVLAGDSPVTLVAYLAIGKWLADAALWGLMAGRGTADNVAALGVALLVAIYTAIAGLAVVTAYRTVT